MRAKLLGCLIVAAGLLIFGGQAFAHHGGAAYSDKMLTLKDAAVTKFVWANPHCIIMFDAKDEHGNLVHWAAEAGSPAALGLLDWTKNSIQPGDAITVYMFPAKSGSPVGRLNRIVLGDGTTLRDSQQGGEKYSPTGEQAKP
jgi:hypothetical protein